MKEKKENICEKCGYPLSACVCVKNKDRKKTADGMFSTSKIFAVADLLKVEVNSEVDEETLDRKLDQIKRNIESFVELLLSQEDLIGDEKDKIREKCEEAEWAASDMLGEADPERRLNYQELCLQYMEEARKIAFKMEA